MATCPACFGHLHEKHSCRARAARTWLRRAAVALSGLAGGYGLAVVLGGQESFVMLLITGILSAGLVDAFAREAFSL